MLYVMLSGHYPFSGDMERTEFFSFQGTRYTEELVRGLIRVRPGDRMSLEECLQCPWMAGLNLINRVQPSDCADVEERGGTVRGRISIRLPHKPKHISKFKVGLEAYSRKYHAAASLQILEVVVILPSGADFATVQKARADLVDVLAKDFPDLKAREKAIQQDQVSMKARADELDELICTYGSQLEVLGELEWRILLSRDNALRIILPARYPQHEPPSPVVECASGLLPWFTEDVLFDLWTPGKTCICEWAEQVREAIVPTKGTQTPSGKSVQKGSMTPMSSAKRMASGYLTDVQKDLAQLPDIVKIPALTIREWTFQGYIAHIENESQVVLIREHLHSSKATAPAQVVIIAYRLSGCCGRGMCISDNNRSKDEEASNQVAAMLDASGCENILIVISHTRNLTSHATRLSNEAFLRQDAKVTARLIDHHHTSSRQMHNS